MEYEASLKAGIAPPSAASTADASAVGAVVAPNAGEAAARDGPRTLHDLKRLFTTILDVTAPTQARMNAVAQVDACEDVVHEFVRSRKDVLVGHLRHTDDLIVETILGMLLKLEQEELADITEEIKTHFLKRVRDKGQWFTKEEQHQWRRLMAEGQEDARVSKPLSEADAAARGWSSSSWRREIPPQLRDRLRPQQLEAVEGRPFIETVEELRALPLQLVLDRIRIILPCGNDCPLRPEYVQEVRLCHADEKREPDWLRFRNPDTKEYHPMLFFTQGGESLPLTLDPPDPPDVETRFAPDCFVVKEPSDRKQKLRETVAAYRRQLLRSFRGQSQPDADAEVFVCICHGSKPSDFDTLAGAGREDGGPTRVCWMLGARAMQELLGKPRPAESGGLLLHIAHKQVLGFSPLDIYNTVVKQGQTYNIVVMAKGSFEARAKRATWDGLRELLSEMHPDLKAACDETWEGVTQTSFEQLEEEYLIDRAAKDPITLSELCRLLQRKQLKPFHMRAWLRLEANVGPNFNGNNDNDTWVIQNLFLDGVTMMEKRVESTTGRDSLDGGLTGGESPEESPQPSDDFDKYSITNTVVAFGTPTVGQILESVCTEFREARREIEKLYSRQQALQPAEEAVAQAMEEEGADEPGGRAGDQDGQRTSPISAADFCKKMRSDCNDLQQRDIDGLCGRVCRGKKAADFSKLDPSDRSVVFFMRYDGLQLLLRWQHDPLEMLLSLGYDVGTIYGMRRTA